MRKRIALSIMLLLSLSTAGLGIQKKQKPEGTPVLWQEPTDIESRDLILGSGGAAMQPDLSRVTFVKDDPVGHSIKYRVRDAAGRIWVTKLDDEAQTETAASRLIWAAGYVTEINYLVPCVKIEGAPEPGERVKRCEGGGFANVKFEARPEDVKRLDPWSWRKNHFSGSREMQGLIVMMSLLNNWDLKDDNNKVLYVRNGGGGRGELHYVISDLGATFGKTGSFLSHTRNRPDHYAKTKFVEGTRGGRVKFAYGGKNSGLFNSITVEQARWIGGLLSRLSDKQLADAFRAANYTPEEVQMLAGAVRARINQLVNVQG
ncbi:MAG: hypothetical protein H0V27_07045 [Pyrinomonadaceae bacterium]|jgi:hypothetical protein|nr:hypothetical protein [Pyrinomonadaceae bacterium]